MEYVVINNARIPIHYGVRVVHELGEHHGQTIGEVMQFAAESANGCSNIATAVRVSNMVMEVSAIALNEGARKSNIDKHYTIDDVVDMVDDDSSALAQFSKLTFAAIIARNQDFMAGQKSPKNPPRKRKPSTPKR